MKILKELDELIAAKVISPEIAERIRLYAQEQKQAFCGGILRLRYLAVRPSDARAGM